LRENLTEACHVAAQERRQDIWPPHSTKRLVNPPGPFHAHEATLYDDQPPPSPARRMFRQKSDHAESSTPGNLTPGGKRRCGGPVASDNTASGKRHFANTDSWETTLQEKTCGTMQVTDSPAGRRHLRGQCDHLEHMGQVAFVDHVESSRRHTRPASVGAPSTRHDGMLPQRRHLTAEDHLWGPAFCAVSSEAQAPCHRGRRCHMPMPSDGVAAALRNEAPAAGSSSQARTRKRGGMEDNLFGATLRRGSRASSTPAERPLPEASSAPRPRRPGSPNDHLMGGFVWRAAPTTGGLGSSGLVPQDSLIGGSFRHAIPSAGPPASEASPKVVTPHQQGHATGKRRAPSPKVSLWDVLRPGHAAPAAPAVLVSDTGSAGMPTGG